MSSTGRTAWFTVYEISAHVYFQRGVYDSVHRSLRILSFKLTLKSFAHLDQNFFSFGYDHYESLPLLEVLKFYGD